MDRTSLHILIAEDEISHSTAMQRELEKAYPAACIEIVSTIREYNSRIKEMTPDIAIIDLNLPDGRTIDLLTTPAMGASFPSIMITSYGNEQVAVDAIKAGALDYIVKSPESFALIAKSVQRALREWRLFEEKNEVERQLKESQIRAIQQEKMASIGQLAAGVAHEINNPMGYITSNMNSLWKYAEKLAQFIEIQGQVIEKFADQETRNSIGELKRQIKLDFVMKDFRELIAESLEGSKRVSKIVQDLKSFSRAEGNNAIPSNINDCIRSTINVVNNEIKYVAELDLKMGEIPLVVCRPQQISQVVMNLLVNAAHAISDKGIITLTTTQVADIVEIRVTDNGCGIPPENLPKIFDPFYTTKEVGKGTGLGLAICHDIIRKHGGELLVMSEVGKGTTFTVRLPVEGKKS